jgi:PKD repeat protein
MLKVLMSSLLVVISMTILIGQDVDERLNNNFKKYSIFDVEISNLAEESFRKEGDTKLRIPSPYGNGLIELELFKSNILAEQYDLLISDGISLKKKDRGDILPMSGLITGRPETRVNVVVADNYFFAALDDGKDIYFYEPTSLYGASIGTSQLVMYKSTDVKPTAGTCGSKVLNEKLNERNSSNSRLAGDCFEVEYAVASDYRMYQDFGNSVGQVEAFVISITDLMNTNYAADFNDELQHILVQQVVSTSSNGDVWLVGGDPGSIDELLDEFTDWGPVGFTAEHDLGSLWTGYDLSGNTIGLAWIGVVCRSFRYNVLEHYSTNMNNLRVLVSHEIGHNYNAGHDAGSGFIMSSTINNTNEWSQESKDVINAYYEPQKISCFDNCSGGGPGGGIPTANFEFEIIEACTVGQVNFTDTSTDAPTSWAWSFQGGNPSTSTSPNPVVNYSQAGVYDVSLTVSNSNGSDNITRNNIIVIEGSPAASFSFQVNGSSVSFFNQSLGATTYLWSFGDGTTSSQTNPQKTYNQPGAYDVSLTATNSCGSDEETVNIVIESPVFADFEVSNNNICEGESVTFSDLSTGNPTSWSWEFEGGTPATSELQNPIVLYEFPGSYDVRLIVTNGSGSDQKTIKNLIQVGELPIAGFSFEVSGPTVTFNNTSINATNYVWRFGDGLASTQENPQHTYEESGTYSVELSASNDCNTDVITQNLEIVLQPIASFSFEGNGSLCSGESIRFFQNSSGNPTSFSWVFEGGTPAVSGAPNPTVTFNESGTFDVTLTVSNNVGSDQLTRSDIIDVNDPPTADFDYILMVGVASFNNLSVGAENIEWDFGDGNNSSETNPVHIYQENGTYTVNITTSNVCGTDAFAQELDVLLVPEANFELDGSSAICAGEMISFQDASMNEPSTWFWEFEGGIPATSTLINPQVSYPDPGIFGISLIVSNNSGADTLISENIIVVNPDPISSFTAAIQVGGLVQFSNSSINATSYHWDFGDGSSSSDLSPSKTYEEEGVYEVVLIATNNCNVNISSQSINTFQLPTAAFSVDASEACIGEPLTLINNSIGADLTFFWQFPGGSPTTSSETAPIITYNDPGVYAISLISTNLAGSDTLILENAVVIREFPKSDIDWVVDNKSITLINNSTGGTENLWDFGDGITSTEFSPDHTYDQEGIYALTHITSNICGADTTVGEVNLFTIPTAQFSVSVAEGCVPLMVSLENNSSLNSVNYQWIIEGGEPSSSQDRSPAISFENPGDYSITLIVSNPAGRDTLITNNAVAAFDIPKEGIESTLDLLDVTFSPVDLRAESYAWDFGDGITSTEASPNHTYDSEGIYTVVMEATNECGTSSTSIEITVNELPAAGFVADTTTTCKDGIIQFEQTSSSNVQSFNWYFEGGSPSISTDPIPGVTYNEPGIYDVMLIVTGVAGADTLLKEDFIEVKTVPDIQSSVEVAGNKISIVNLTPDALSSIVTIGDETFIGDSIDFTASQNGIYNINLEVSNACGSGFTSFTEEITVYPEALLSFTSIELCKGDPFVLKSIRKKEEEVYQWFITSVDTTILLSGSEAVFQADKIDVYDLLLTVSNQYGIDSLFLEGAIVVEGPILADFTVELNDNEVSGSIDNKSDATYHWDMGDGSTYAGDSIFHMYQEDGIYLVQVIASNICGNDTASLVLEALTSGVSGPEWAQDLVVYPNPVKSDLNISVKGNNEPLKVHIRDINGKSIKFFNLEMGNSENKIDLTDLQPAVYIISITDGLRFIHRKFIKVD